MIIKSTLDIDRREGTADLACAAAHTAAGQTIGYEGVMRMLVWHAPEPQQFTCAVGVVSVVSDRLQARRARVVGITPNLFALGLYPDSWNPFGNPAAIVLLEISSEGELLSAEEWNQGAGRLSRVFDSHKDDEQPLGWLPAISATWRRQEMTIEVFSRHTGYYQSPKAQRIKQNHSQPKPVPRHARSAAVENTINEARPQKVGSKRERAKINKQLRQQT